MFQISKEKYIKRKEGKKQQAEEKITNKKKTNNKKERSESMKIFKTHRRKNKQGENAADTQVCQRFLKVTL